MNNKGDVCYRCMSGNRKIMDFKKAEIRRLIPEKFIGANINQFPMSISASVLGAMKEGKGAYLWGKTGSGKTHFVCALLIHCIGESVKIDRVKWEEFCLRIRETYGVRAAETEMTILTELNRPEVLFIEDLGATSKENPSDNFFPLRLMYLLLDHRYEHCKPTIITSNLSVSDLSERFDEKIASRICGMCISIEFKGKDRRLGDSE